MHKKVFKNINEIDTYFDKHKDKFDTNLLVAPASFPAAVCFEKVNKDFFKVLGVVEFTVFKPDSLDTAFKAIDWHKQLGNTGFHKEDLLTARRRISGAKNDLAKSIKKDTLEYASLKTREEMAIIEERNRLMENSEMGYNTASSLAKEKAQELTKEKEILRKSIEADKLVFKAFEASLHALAADINHMDELRRYEHLSNPQT